MSNLDFKKNLVFDKMDEHKFGFFFTTQQECYTHFEDDEKCNDNNYTYIAKDIGVKGAKQYTAFRTLGDYLRFLDNKENKNYYEQIRFQCPEYFDIDENDNEFWAKVSTSEVIDTFLKLRREWGTENNYSNGSFSDKKDVYVLSSKFPGIKKSFHITIRNGFLFESPKQQSEYINDFVTFLKTKGMDFLIDKSVYSSNRCFRTIDCCKMGSKRVLERSDYNKTSKKCNKKLFFNSYIEPELKEAQKKSCISLVNNMGINMNKFYLKPVTGFTVKISKSHLDKKELILTDHEYKIMFDHLSPTRWGNYQDCLNLIWYGTKIGLSSGDIHNYCRKSSNYSEQWVDGIIDSYDGDKNRTTIGTLCKYLKEDVDYETFNRIVPKEKTFQEIMSIPVKERTQMEQKFVDYIIQKITQKNISFLLKPNLIEPINDDSEYVNEKHFNTKEKVICVKAKLGKGKSTASEQHINKQKYDNIVIVAPRRSYAKSCCERMIRGTNLDFKCYIDLKKTFIDTPFIVIQAESLHRLNIRNGNNLLIIDESEAFLYQLTSTKTHADNHIKNVETFMSLVKNSSKILAMDAFLSNRTLETFNLLLSKNDIKFINYTQNLTERKVTRIDNIDIFISKLISDLEQGKRIFLFSSSNSKLLTKKKKSYKDPQKPDIIISALLPAIREKFPEKTILEFHSNYVSVQLKNVNEQWDDADLVACTSTITVGINHDKKGVFNKVYLYANASSGNLVRDMFQASYRVRHLIDDEMVCCIDKKHYGKNLTTNINEIKKDLNEKHTSVINHFKAYDKKKFPYETPRFIEYLSSFNKLESNFSIMNLEDFFNAYLHECNYKYSEEHEDILEIEFDEFIKPTIDYDDIVEIVPSRAKQLINKKKTIPLTEEENSSLEKYHFQNILLYKAKDVEKPLWDIYTNFGKGKFRNISTEKGLSEGTITLQDLIDKNSYSHLNDGFSMRCQIIKEIFNWIGCNSQDFSKKIKKETLNNLIGKFEENKKKIHIAFDIREKKGEMTLKSTVGLINSALSKWGYSKIKKGERKSVKIKGKVIDLADYQIINLNGEIDVHKYIKPRTSTKDQKLHPMLHKDDRKFITETELEYIRLNTVL